MTATAMRIESCAEVKCSGHTRFTALIPIQKIALTTAANCDEMITDHLCPIPVGGSLENPSQ
jgi:hypothetical protein